MSEGSENTKQEEVENTITEQQDEMSDKVVASSTSTNPTEDESEADEQQNSNVGTDQEENTSRNALQESDDHEEDHKPVSVQEEEKHTIDDSTNVPAENIAQDAEKEEAYKPQQDTPLTTDTTQELQQQEEITSEDDQEDEEPTDHEEDSQHGTEPDYSHFSKEELVKAIEEQVKNDNVKKSDTLAQEIKVSFDELEAQTKESALKKFVAEGGEKDGFEFKSDELHERFYQAYKFIKERKSSYYSKLGQDRNKNYEAKQDVLNRLRDFIDSEETQVSINKLKELQKEWRSIGPVPPQHNRTLWANYNALINRFYDNRSIYFELKELDRKKNLEAKLALCEKIENLVSEEDIKKALRELDELHEEYKHLGPVPKEDQETLWQRFKSASDKIHEKRRAYVDQFKEELNKNLAEKLKLCDELSQFTEFRSDSIREWNQKTKEIQDLQKRWDAVGAMPRERAKNINKKFWSNFKQFFAHKGDFFKQLDAQREDNLAKKEKLVEEAANVKDSTDWQKTANDLKRLQKEWKEIGPVPEKVRNELYQRFKSACDAFFEKKRESNKETESNYEKNLEAKEAICTQIENLAKAGSSDSNQLQELSEAFAEIGFVPRNAIKKINQRFEKSVETFMKEAKGLDAQQKDDLKLELEVTTIKGTPRAERKLDNKEYSLRKKISSLEEDVSLWKNNISFFANSKNADKLRTEYEQKIAEAESELAHLKSQLDIIENLR